MFVFVTCYLTHMYKLVFFCIATCNTVLHRLYCVITVQGREAIYCSHHTVRCLSVLLIIYGRLTLYISEGGTG